METISKFTGLLFIVLVFNSGSLAQGSTDWPMWRYDQARRGFAEITLPDNPVLLWTRQLEKPKRGWPFQYEDYFTSGNPDRIGKLSFDISYEPVIGDGKLFVPSMVSDKITAFSAETGNELWNYYAGGPVRFAPVYDAGKVYFASDDGYLYCLDAGTGELNWKYKGSYTERMVLGNERIISMWPARGGPVIMDGVIYFAAGIMPFEGIFIHAVDAVTGNEIWINSTVGSIWSLYQHGGAYSYGGPVPQGYLAISGDKLIVPGGRTPPAVLDRNTGELLYFNQATGMVGKGAGGYRVFAADNWFFNHGILYSMDDGAQFGRVPGDVITDDAFIGAVGNSLFAHKSELKTVEVKIEDRLQRGAIAKNHELEELWEAKIDGVDRLFLKTSSHFVISKNEGRTASLVAVSAAGKPGRVVWEHNTDSEIWSMLAANGKLYAVTREGKLYCFGTGVTGPIRHHAHRTETYTPEAESAELAVSIIHKSDTNAGYGLVYGGNNGDLIKALADNSSMHIVVVEPDAEKAGMLRRTFDKAGIYGSRVAVINEGRNSSAFLPYIYDLIIVNGNEHSVDQITKVFNSLRPYGGKAFFPGAGNDFTRIVNSLNLENGKLQMENGFAMITREGALPGSGEWTHQYGSATNRTYSDDELVKPPLGTLWFGGPSNLNALPRHHNGPIPQVAGGRLIILGMETISARCVYTGRELWVKEIPGIGHTFTSLEHEQLFRDGNEVFMGGQPGSNYLGSPYVSLEDAVYIFYRDRLLSLDANTGEINIEFRLPAIRDISVREFSHIMISGDYLITTIDPQLFDDGVPGKEDNWNATSSSVLLVMDRRSGELLWTKRAKTGFRHNAMVAGNDRLFLVDGLSDGVIDILQRRGINEQFGSELMALDLKTGGELWSLNDDVFGTWLGYYEDKNILLQGGRYSQLRPLPDEPRDRLNAHNSLTGEILWESRLEYAGPLSLHSDMIIMAPGTRTDGSGAIEPLTGNIFRRDHPLTGEQFEWNYHRYYGCGVISSSPHLLMFRSGTAGYSDLLNFGGTTNFGGFRAGCTSNLIAANGVLNAPDYTRTCTCSYPLQTSVGLVHMPDVGIEMWTLNRLEAGHAAIRSLGINFAGQGNRREDGVLWLEYPKVYGQGPDLPVKIESDSPTYFRNHASWIENGDEKYPWVASYGVKGITSVSADLVPAGSKEGKYYNVTLYFAEPEDISAGERIFDVSIQGEKVLENFDIVQEAGGPKRVLRKEFRGIKVNDTLNIGFSSNLQSTVISGIEIVIEDSKALTSAE